MFDLHCHSNNSFDSKESINNMVLSAIDKNIKYIAFTEHYSSNKNKKTYGHFNKKKFEEEILKASQLSNEITILKALEICEPHLENLESIDLNGFDFTIGSIHNVGSLSLRNLCSKYNKTDAYNIYFEEYLKMVTLGGFNIAAHLDLMNRYAFDTLGNYDFNLHKDIIEEILKKIISNDIALEVNCSGLRKSLNSLHPSLEVLKLYKSLGGELITIGSDAHKASDIFCGCNYGLEVIKKLGFNYIYTFEKFQRKKHKIKN